MSTFRKARRQRRVPAFADGATRRAGQVIGRTLQTDLPEVQALAAPAVEDQGPELHPVMRRGGILQGSGFVALSRSRVSRCNV